MRIGLTSILVDDQDRAERFYTEVLGFNVKTNAAYGPGERWLSVVAPEDPDGAQLVLHLTESTSTRTDTGASRDGPHPRGPGASMGPLLASNLMATTRKELR